LGEEFLLVLLPWYVASATFFAKLFDREVLDTLLMALLGVLELPDHAKHVDSIFL